MHEKWSAIRAEDSRRFEFIANKGPKCPHCGEEIDIVEHELWQLYDYQDQDIECPLCGNDFHVHVLVSYSTDDQPDMDDEPETEQEDDQQ